MNDHPPVVVIGDGFLEGWHLVAAFCDLVENGAIGLSLELGYREVTAGSIEACSLGPIAKTRSSMAGFAMLGIQVFAVCNIFLAAGGRIIHCREFCGNNPWLDTLGVHHHKQS